jgi:hypothetical protein
MRLIIEMLSVAFFMLLISAVVSSHYETAAVFASLFTLCVCTLAICESTRESSK